MQEMMCPQGGAFAPGSLLELNSHTLNTEQSGWCHRTAIPNHLAHGQEDI